MTYIEKLKKSYIFRMRMIKRCVKHNAQKAAQKYRDALVTEDGVFIK